MHLEWRQTNVPMPRLNDQVLNVLNKGLMYIHGRTKDLSPVLYMDFAKLGPLLKNKEIDDKIYVQLHNFYARYILNNMQVPGQAEKWVTYTNINKFSLSDLPIGLFKDAAKDLGSNWIDHG